MFRLGDSCAAGAVFRPETGQCVSIQKGAPKESDNSPKSCTGNPIIFSIGNKYQIETDYTHAKNETINFSRSYNSLDGVWRHNYSTHLKPSKIGSNQYLTLVMADGSEGFFTVQENLATSDSINLGKLSKEDEHWVYTSTENERFVFNEEGKNIKRTSPKGREQTLLYENNKITVTDNYGQSLLITEDLDHQPLTFNTSNIQITYNYNTNKRLTSLSRTSSGTTSQRQFHYEDSNNNALLTGITDELNVRYATWKYDNQGRAISSEHADSAEKILVSYNPDGSTTITNELGKRTTYRFQVIQGIKRITAIEGEPSPNCPNSNSTFTYDQRGLLKTKTDNRGLTTTYDYNARGLESSRTEAAGTPQARTIVTDWHPTLFLPVTITEPDRITTYQYDEQGRPLGRTTSEF
ncbi:RHS repeat protein [Pseudomonas sp. BN415]|nr:RHS repeat protein [Pseudomonas sp. BN415]